VKGTSIPTAEVSAAGQDPASYEVTADASFTLLGHLDTPAPSAAVSINGGASQTADNKGALDLSPVMDLQSRDDTRWQNDV
jgi:hypothetical protein